ncbi:MAG: hypothetical protein KC940_05220, partial [Candidatus Omnitrophica bacterium]|nr:hypothetical protein [Candidatus Omnitrophota bacterium]
CSFPVRLYPMGYSLVRESQKGLIYIWSGCCLDRWSRNRVVQRGWTPNCIGSRQASHDMGCK